MMMMMGCGLCGYFLFCLVGEGCKWLWMRGRTEGMEEMAGVWTGVFISVG